MFRNLTFFEYPRYLMREELLQMLDRETPKHAAKPVGAMELSSRGWIKYAELDDRGEALPFIVGEDAVILTLGGEDKILPSAAVNRELDKRLKEIEQREGRRPGGRARKALKDEVVAQMLPRALIKPYRLDGYLDLKRGIVVVDTASQKAAEEWVTNLRATIGSFPALPMVSGISVRGELTRWLSGLPGELAPKGWVIGDECRLQDAADKGAVVTVRRMELDGGELTSHLEAGKQCTRLGLYVGDRLSFTLDESLTVRKLKFLDGSLDAIEQTEREDLGAELDARAWLMVTEVGNLIDAIGAQFKVVRATVDTRS